MINELSIKNVVKSDDPFLWFKYNNLIDLKIIEQYVASYPVDGFERMMKTMGDKAYSFEIKNIIIDDMITKQYKKLSQPWKNFIAYISSQKYKKMIGNSININIKNNKISIAFYKFDKHDGIAPHLDKKNKIFTQLFYFNDKWEPDWGGQLILMRGNKPGFNDIIVEPNLSHSILLYRSELAWHRVKNVSPKAQASRKTLQLEVWDNE